MIHSIPSLPHGGPLRLLAISGSVSLLAFLASAIVLLARGRRPEAAWAAAPFGMLLAAFALGRLLPSVHPVAAAATFVLAARNTLRFRGVSRLLQAAGLIAWIVAIVAARALFGNR